MKLITIHIANIQMQGKWQLHHSLQISRRGRPWLSLASWLVPDSPSYVLMVLAGRVQIFYIDINKCLDFSSSTVMWVSDLFNQFSISLKTLMISFFLTLCYYFSLLSLTCFKSVRVSCESKKASWALKLNKITMILPQMYKLHWSHWCDGLVDFGLSSYEPKMLVAEIAQPWIGRENVWRQEQ